MLAKSSCSSVVNINAMINIALVHAMEVVECLPPVLVPFSLAVDLFPMATPEPHPCAFPKWEERTSLTPAPLRDHTEDQMISLRTDSAAEFIYNFCDPYTTI